MYLLEGMQQDMLHLTVLIVKNYVLINFHFLFIMFWLMKVKKHLSWSYITKLILNLLYQK